MCTARRVRENHGEKSLDKSTMFSPECNRRERSDLGNEARSQGRVGVSATAAEQDRERSKGCICHKIKTLS